MEVVSTSCLTKAPPSTSSMASPPPFRNRDVQEWTRMDDGLFERARLETDHWVANTTNASHKYDKVVDSRIRSDANGALHQRARRQLEVFQSTVPGGHLQVIKTHTISSNRWSNKEPERSDEPNFEDLDLSLNSLDLTSQKSKAIVGRSGRRPPSQTRRKEAPTSSTTSTTNQNSQLNTAAVNLRRISRLCNQIHESAVRQTFDRPPIHERGSGDGVEIVEIEDNSLTRAKSTSSEELYEKSNKSIEDLEDLEQLQIWRRTSKLRRSLQFPKQKASPTKPPDLPENTGSVKRIREDLEVGRRLNTALRGNNVDFGALDQILQSISSSSIDKHSSSEYEAERDVKTKRNSFVTVESLQQVRDNLRRTSSFSGNKKDKEEEADDGIVEDNRQEENKNNSRVRSYVFGMEAMMKGTGSLESKTTKQFGACRNEDWYNRRKSYGFEQVHSEDSHMSKKIMDSSTDSGICRSNETVPAINKTSVQLNKEEDRRSMNGHFRANGGNVKRYTSMFEQRKENNYWNRPQKDIPRKDFGTTTITIPIPNQNESDIFNEDNLWRENNTEIKRHSIAVDECKYVSKDKLFEEDKKPQKKVEFCKTEVHFAADSGRVNIVETDEKPPPTNNFRRRRRNSATQYIPFDDFNKNGLPVLHFGDEKLFEAKSYNNNTNHQQNEDLVTTTVTVSTNKPFDYTDNNQKDSLEVEAPKGILKNKPIKPKPYLLGEENLYKEDDENIWGVKLKPIKQETPMWRSTVTLKNTLYDEEDNNQDGASPEPHNTLKTQRPREEGVSRRSSWSADRTKLEDEKIESRGYSTKINIGGGEATVVENDTKGKHPTWPRRDEVKDDRKQILSKGLVVRIGRNERENATTTTKITIDLSPSPTKNAKEPEFLKAPHNFKSTSLILNTFKAEQDRVKSNGIPQQLEALKKLYDDWQSDNEADREVQSLLNESRTYDEDNSSVVSGSWSKVRAFRNLQQQKNKTSSMLEFKSRARVEKDFSSLRTNHHQEDLQDASHLNVSSPVFRFSRHNLNNEKLSSPFLVVQNVKEEIMGQQTKTSSPPRRSPPKGLTKRSPKTSPLRSREKQSPLLIRSEKRSPSPSTQLERPSSRTSPLRNEDKQQSSLSGVTEESSPSPSIKHETVREKSPSKVMLRNPTKSEMAYFGVKTSPSHKSIKKQLSPKPVQKVEKMEKAFSASRLEKSPIKSINKLEKTSSKTSTDRIVVRSEPSPPDSPIYENIDDLVTPSPPPTSKLKKNVIPPSPQPPRTPKHHQETSTSKTKEVKVQKQTSSSKAKKEIDSKGLLDELAQAADQMLKAVSGFVKAEEEERRYRKQKLDTISENKSWHRTAATQANEHTKLKLTSSTSSIESGGNKRSTRTEDRYKKKESSKAVTKARRLQRASSREALLQSHGSSSEEVNVEVPRKPRLVKKKSTEAENKISRNSNTKKREEKKPLPEIRHKTAVSTIRSVAEKASLERMRKADESKKKPSGRSAMRT